MKGGTGWKQVVPIEGHWQPFSFVAVAVQCDDVDSTERVERKVADIIVAIHSVYSNGWRHFRRAYKSPNEFWIDIHDSKISGDTCYIVAYKGADAWPMLDGWKEIERSNLNVISCGLERRPFWVQTVQPHCRPVNYVALENFLPNISFECDDVGKEAEKTTALLCSMIDFWRTHECGPWAWTTASQSWSMFRKKFLERIIERPHDADENLLARSCYYGPKCQPYYCGHVPTPVTVWDVAAQYPYVCTITPVPVKLILHERFSDGLPSAYVNDAVAAGNVAADCIVSVGPYKRHLRDGLPSRGADGEINYVQGRFRTQLAGPELAFAWRQGWVERLLEVAIYECKPILNKMQRQLWEWRTVAHNAGATDLESWIKLLANSLIGKFGQRGPKWRRDRDTVAKEQWGEWIETVARSTTIENGKTGPDFVLRSRLRSINGQVWREDNTGESPHAFPAIAAWIQSAARVYVANMVRQLPLHWLLYSDTDSLHIPSMYSPLAALSGIMPSAGMGALRKEHEGDSADYYGWKNYRVGGKHVASGEPQICKVLEGGRLEVWCPDPPFATVPYRDKCEMRYRKKIIMPNERDLRGDLAENGRVWPYVIKGDVDAESPLADWLVSHSPPQ